MCEGVEAAAQQEDAAAAAATACSAAFLRSSKLPSPRSRSLMLAEAGGVEESDRAAALFLDSRFFCDLVRLLATTVALVKPSDTSSSSTTGTLSVLARGASAARS